MYYFRFEIPAGVKYSPNWHGTMPRCPKDVEVLLYNDKEGYGIAKTEDIFKPPEVEVLAEAEALKVVREAQDEEGVYFGQKLADRWLPEAETEKETTKSGEPVLVSEQAGKRVVVDTFIKFCPTCHQIVAKVDQYEDGSVAIWQNGKKLIDGIKAASIVLSCANGHRVKVVLNGR